MTGLSILWQAVLGAALGAIIGLVGRRWQVMTHSGWIATVVIAATIFALGGWVWGSVLIVHWAANGLWAGYRAREKMRISDRFRKGAAQRWPHVLARTGWALLLVSLHRFGSSHTTLFVAYVGSLATASADTWATEIGVFSPTPPRRVTTWRPAQVGSAGSISALGIIASLAGAWTIGFAGLLTPVIRDWAANLAWDRDLLWLPLAAALGGTAGSLLDSFLGATGQAIYYCDSCGTETEHRVHDCGQPTRQIRGWPWLTNDAVNLVASVVGAAATAASLVWLAHSKSIW